MELKTLHYSGPNLIKKTGIAIFFWGWIFYTAWWLVRLVPEYGNTPWLEIIMVGAFSGFTLLSILVVARNILKMEQAIIANDEVQYARQYCLFPFMVKRWQEPISAFNDIFIEEKTEKLILAHATEEAKNVKLNLPDGITKPEDCIEQYRDKLGIKKVQKSPNPLEPRLSKPNEAV